MDLLDYSEGRCIFAPQPSANAEGMPLQKRVSIISEDPDILQL